MKEHRLLHIKIMQKKQLLTANPKMGQQLLPVNQMNLHQLLPGSHDKRTTTLT